MKHALTILAVLLMAVGVQAQNYDFLATAPSGQTLYYKILSPTTVGLTFPQYGNNSYYDGYTKPTGDLVIPSSVTNSGTTYSVTDITINAFRGCESITSVDIPSSVTTIGQYAFYNCTGNSSLTLHEGIQTISQYAFYHNPIQVLTIPRSIISLGGYSFASTTLHTVNYNADSCTHMGRESSSNSYVFAGCTNLNHVNFGSHVKVVPAYAFVENPIDTLVFSNSIRVIETNAFWQCGIDTIIWGNSIDSIGNSAFRRNPTLHMHTLPASLRAIGDDAFACDQGANNVVTSLTVPSNIKYIGSGVFNGWNALTNLYFNADSCYNKTENESSSFVSGCPNLTSITIGNNVKRIPNYAFTQTTIVNIHIPGSVKKIGNGAFSACHSLVGVIMEDGVEEIGQSAFSYCDTLSSVQLSSTLLKINANAFANCTTLTAIVIPNNVGVLGYNCFDDCSNLASIQLPESLDTIDYNAFEDCTSLTSIQLPESLKYIGQKAFFRCTSLASISIPKYLRSIGLDLARGCSSLTTVYFNADSCYSYNWVLGNNAHYPFSNCPIDSIVIGDNVKYIMPNIFSGLSQVSQVVIPDSIAVIGASAFSNMTALANVSLGSGLMEIGSNAFSGCTAITAIYSDAESAPNISSSSFENSVKNVPLYVKCNALYDYQHANIWNTFSNYQLMSGDYSIHISSAEADMGSAEYVTTNCAANSATIEAVPATHYRFIGWSDGSNDNPRSLSLTSDTVLVASFEPDTFIVNAIANVDTMGAVLGSGIYFRGDTARIYAFANGRNHFNHWNDNSTINPATLTVTGDTSITAFFAAPPRDTVIQIDTLIQVDTLEVHDTTYIDIHDTIYLDHYITDTIYIHDTVYVGIDEVEMLDAKIYQRDGRIVVESGDGSALGEVRVFDVAGRMLTHSSVSPQGAASSPNLGEQLGWRVTFEVPGSGTYIVKIGDHPARKIVVIR